MCAEKQLYAARQSYSDASGDQRKQIKEKLQKFNSLIVHPTEYLGQRTGTRYELQYCRKTGVANKACDSDVAEQKIVSDFRMMQGPNGQMDPTVPMQNPGTTLRKGKHLEIVPRGISDNYTRVIFKTSDKYVYDRVGANDSDGSYWKIMIDNGTIIPVSSKAVNELQCGKLASLADL
jgi:hypothetical protein